MSIAPKPKLTAREYLEIEESDEFRREFVNGALIEMPITNVDHSRIKTNLIGEIGIRLKGGPCGTLSSSQRVLVEATGSYLYPDILVLRWPGKCDPVDRDTLTDPIAIIEILSPSTERYDRGAKFRDYQQIPSLTEYLLVAQDEAVCERFVRRSDGSWALISFVGLEATLELTSIPVRIPLTDIYAGVVLPESPPQSSHI